jgi:hypothetical protein
MHSEQTINEGDTSVMLVFPKDATQYHIVGRPLFVQANTVSDLRDAVNKSVASQLDYIPGYNYKAPPPGSYVEKKMDELVIADTPAPKRVQQDTGAQLELPGSDFLLNVSDIK